MSWDVARARRSNRRWAAAAVALTMVPVLLGVALVTMPYWWSRVAWAGQTASAVSIRDYDGVPANATYEEAVAKLGPELYSGPGFETNDVYRSGVLYWRGAEGDIRGLVENGRMVGRLKVGTWR